MKQCNYWDRKRINDTDFDGKSTFIGFLHPMGMEIWWMNPPDGEVRKIIISPPFDSLVLEERIEKLQNLGFPNEFIEDALGVLTNSD